MRGVGMGVRGLARVEAGGRLCVSKLRADAFVLVEPILHLVMTSRALVVSRQVSLECSDDVEALQLTRGGALRIADQARLAEQVRAVDAIIWVVDLGDQSRDVVSYGPRV